MRAAEEALDDAGLPRVRLGDGHTGLAAASGGSPGLIHTHLAKMEESGWRRAHPMGVVRSVSGTLNFNLAAHYGITGANCGFVSACSSGSHALGYASDEIALGRQDRMLVVAGEDGDTASLLPFLGLRALSSQHDPDHASRPFDAARDGFVGSGGGVAVVLESAESAGARSVRPMAKISAWSQTCDGHSVAAPHPEGRGLESAMRACLDRAGTAQDAVDWVCAHATSTPAGDRAEAQALHAVGFADSNTAISSVKGLTGHGLSQAGLLEAAIAVLAIDGKFIPGNAGLVNPDPACDGLHLPRTTETTTVQRVLNNSSGFGGSNVCHLIETP